LVFIFIYLLAFPSEAAATTESAVELCLKTLIPSLFIYTVLSKIIVSLPIINKSASVIGIAPITLFVGLLCGAPLGAKTAAELYESGSISKKYAEYLCSFCNNASLPFVVGFVGGRLFQSTEIGLRLFAYQLAGSLFAAVVMRIYIFGFKRINEKPRSATKRVPLQTALREAVGVMASICACATFFSVLASVTARLLPFPFSLLIGCLLEFSSGCVSASRYGEIGVVLAALSIGLLSASVAMQVRSVTNGRLSLKPYLLGKLLCGGVSVLLAVIFG